MAKYRKKPVIIEAEQWIGTKESFDKIISMGLKNWKPGEIGSDTFFIETLESNEFLVHNTDWIIKGIKGEFYACNNDIFIKSYDFVEE